jgi:Protein of unknown function (DUF2934)
MTKSTPTRSSTRAKTTPAAPTAPQIAERAHQIYEARGGHQGHELSDWLQAERELRTEAANDAPRPKPKAAGKPAAARSRKKTAD